MIKNEIPEVHKPMIRKRRISFIKKNPQRNFSNFSIFLPIAIFVIASIIILISFVKEKAGDIIADVARQEAKQLQTKLSNFKLNIIKESDGWKILNYDFYNYEIISDDNVVCLSEKDTENYNCISKLKNKREFVECFEDKCSSYGEISEKGDEFIYRVNGKSFSSQKITDRDNTIIKINSVDKKIIYASIFIRGQGSNLNEATFVEIINYDEDLQIESLTLIAARNLVTYESKRSNRQIFRFATNVGLILLKNLG